MVCPLIRPFSSLGGYFSNELRFVRTALLNIPEHAQIDIDLSAVEQLVEASQTRAVGDAISLLARLGMPRGLSVPVRAHVGLVADITFFRFGLFFSYRTTVPQVQVLS